MRTVLAFFLAAGVLVVVDFNIRIVPLTYNAYLTRSYNSASGDVDFYHFCNGFGSVR